MNTPTPKDVAPQQDYSNHAITQLASGEVIVARDDEAQVGELIDELAQLARERGDDATPIAAGTFAMYPMPDGGVMFVTDCPIGPMQGTNRTRIPPAMIRAVSVLAGGGSKMQAFKALMGGGRRAPREIAGG